MYKLRQNGRVDNTNHRVQKKRRSTPCNVLGERMEKAMQISSSRCVRALVCSSHGWHLAF
eukprot:3722314-Pyramimonas_sp.AAC.1